MANENENDLSKLNVLQEIDNEENSNYSKNYICYNEALKRYKTLSNYVLEEFYSNLISIDESAQIVKKLNDYKQNIDFCKWKTSLKIEDIDKKISKCDKNINCLTHEISQNDLTNIFYYPSRSFSNQQKEFKAKEKTLNNERNSIGTESDKRFKEVDPEITEDNINHIKTYRKFTHRNQNVKISEIENLNFKSARDELSLQNLNKYGESSKQNLGYGTIKKTLGTRRTPRSEFVPPIKKEFHNISKSDSKESNMPIDERLINIDPKMIELINNEVINKVEEVSWNDIAGLDYAKSIIKEAIIWPILRPDIFTGIRRPPKGILFFGPPGTGKTLIGKCIATQSKSKFFSISASSITSKWIGEGEKMVRALFAVAAVDQPSVIFIDEIDSLLCQRSETEHESSRRLKTEFLVQLDGTATSKDDRILIIGATNRPQELDDAARRRFVRRLYIPLPDERARTQILENLMKNVKNTLLKSDFEIVGKMTENYSGADIASLCQEASMEPLRAIPNSQMMYFDKNNVRPVILLDFQESIKKIRSSVSINDLNQYLEWDNLYGSGS